MCDKKAFGSNCKYRTFMSATARREKDRLGVYLAHAYSSSTYCDGHHHYVHQAENMEEWDKCQEVLKQT